MREVFKLLIAGLLLAAAYSGAAEAQNKIQLVATCGTASPAPSSQTLYMDTTGNLCTSATGGGGGGTTTATASATPTPVTAGTGKPFNIDLFSGLYTDIEVGGVAVSTGAPFPVTIVSGGGSGGTSSTFGSAFPTAGTAIGITDGTNMIALKGSATLGAFVDVTTLPSLVAGSAIIGKVGIDQTTPGTTNGVVVNSSALPTGAATSALQTTGNTSLGSIVTNTTGIATAANQTTGNNSLAAIVTNTANTAITPVIAGSAASSAVLKASAGSLYGVYANSTAAGWLMVFNATSAPGNGATTAGTASGNLQDCIPISAGGSNFLNYNPGPPEAFSVGITAVVSSTACATLTLATTGFIHGSVK